MKSANHKRDQGSEIKTASCTTTLFDIFAEAQKQSNDDHRAATAATMILLSKSVRFQGVHVRYKLVLV